MRWRPMSRFEIARLHTLLKNSVPQIPRQLESVRDKNKRFIGATEARALTHTVS